MKTVKIYTRDDDKPMVEHELFQAGMGMEVFLDGKDITNYVEECRTEQMIDGTNILFLVLKVNQREVVFVS